MKMFQADEKPTPEIGHLLRESVHGVPPLDLESVRSLVEPTNSSRPLILYRGPLQRHRLRVVTRALDRDENGVDFVWLVPSILRPEGILWLDELPGLAALRLIDARKSRFPSTLRALRHLDLGERATAAFVNFSAFHYSMAVSAERTAWVVQGLPEEDEFLEKSLTSRAQIELLWRFAGFLRKPEVTIAVSKPMAEFIQKRLPKHDVVVVPNSVSDDSFIEPMDATSRTLVYMGSGAEWQNLEHTAELWAAIHELDPSIDFRVVSTDDRTEILRSGLPEEKIEFRSAWYSADVAAELSGCMAGFILATPHLVNRVRCPTKYAEYLGASVPVIATDMAWDVADSIRENGCGLLLKPEEPTQAQAEAVVEWLRSDAHRRAVESTLPTGKSLSDTNISNQLQALMVA